MQTKIHIRDVDFYYGATHVLKSINLNILEKRVTALIGPSGCGKSTLLRAINRIYDLYPHQHATGKILLDDKDILNAHVDLNQLRSRVGMVFQKPTPFPMSIFNNVAFGVKLHAQLDREALAGRVEWALRKADLWHQVKDKLKQSGLGLSGGQQQRLCIARAIAVHPEVLLLDEPTSALDPIATGHIESLISELREDYTILMVTHNMQQAARISDFTAYMYLGRLVEYNATDIIFQCAREPATRAYVAGAFG